MKFDLRYAMGEFSSRVLSMVNIKPKVDVGFLNFFGEEVLSTKGFNFWVSRQNRRVAVDINPYERGNINSLDKSTNKYFIPPTYDEAIIYSAFDEFETIMGMDDSLIDGQIYRKLVEKTAEEMQLSLDKIARAEELQRAQALQTGIITLKNGDNIDFQRKAGSLVAYNASFGWDVDTVNPEAIIIQLIEFMITEGAVDATTPLNVVVGAEAWSAFKNNPIRQKEGDIKDQTFMSLSTGETMRGLTPQGSYSAGNYKVNFWGYTGYYDDPNNSNTTTPYMNPKKIVVLPNTVPFKMVYCGTKGWSDGDGLSKNAKPRIIKAKRNFYKVRSIREVTEELGVRSAPVASLFEVDSVATAQVVAP
jgi:hypothetical protein